MKQKLNTKKRMARIGDFPNLVMSNLELCSIIVNNTIYTYI